MRAAPQRSGRIRACAQASISHGRSGKRRRFDRRTAIELE
jgi:hypothetical protein